VHHRLPNSPRSPDRLHGPASRLTRTADQAGTSLAQLAEHQLPPDARSRELAPGTTYSAGVSPGVSAILLDAGGVLVFPQPDLLRPSLRTLGLAPDVASFERAHYRAMVAQDLAGTPPVAGTWWREYLAGYLAACGVAEDRCRALAAEVAEATAGRAWTHVGTGVMPGLRALAALGLPMGVVSNSDGTVQAELRRLGVCYAADGQKDGRKQDPPHGGVPVGVVIDSAVVGVAKPDPAIFGIALEALRIPASRTILHVGDSLRYDVAGAQAAGLQPVHLDPHGFCPAPDGHRHIRTLTELARSIGSALTPRRR
jgi:putative hydrolase of the HAD superfamily